MARHGQNLGADAKLDVVETDNQIEISAELPGLEEKDVQVNVADNVLTINGEKKAEKEEKDKNYRMFERSYGSFSRRLEPACRDQSRQYQGQSLKWSAQGNCAKASAGTGQKGRSQGGCLGATEERVPWLIAQNALCSCARTLCCLARDAKKHHEGRMVQLIQSRRSMCSQPRLAG